MFDKMEDDFELYTVKKFHEAMEKLDDEVYSSKITRIELKPMYFSSKHRAVATNSGSFFESNVSSSCY